MQKQLTEDKANLLIYTPHTGNTDTFTQHILKTLTLLHNTFVKHFHRKLWEHVRIYIWHYDHLHFHTHTMETNNYMFTPHILEIFTLSRFTHRAHWRLHSVHWKYFHTAMCLTGDISAFTYISHPGTHKRLQTYLLFTPKILWFTSHSLWTYTVGTTHNVRIYL